MFPRLTTAAAPLPFMIFDILISIARSEVQILYFLRGSACLHERILIKIGEILSNYRVTHQVD